VRHVQARGQSEPDVIGEEKVIAWVTGSAKLLTENQTLHVRTASNDLGQPSRYVNVFDALSNSWRNTMGDREASIIQLVDVVSQLERQLWSPLRPSESP
jgi:hypothetical protein